MSENHNTYKFRGLGLNKHDKVPARKRFNDYQAKYSIDALSDLLILEELVFREIIQDKLKVKIGEIISSEVIQESNIIPSHLQEEYDKNEDRILILKDKLGLFIDKKVNDPYEKHEILERKAKIYRQDHPEEFKVTCPFCSEIFFLNRRIDKYEVSQLRLYKNKVLCNEGLWSLFKEGKITREDVAKVLNVSKDYVDFLEKKIYPSK